VYLCHLPLSVLFEISSRLIVDGGVFIVAAGAVQSGRKKTREPKEENVTLGPAVREGEYVFGVAHIFASFNDTFIVRRSNPPKSISIRFVCLSEGSREMGEKWKLTFVLVCVVAACDGSVWEGNARPHHWYIAFSCFYRKSYCIGINV